MTQVLAEIEESTGKFLSAGILPIQEEEWENYRLNVKHLFNRDMIGAYIKYKNEDNYIKYTIEEKQSEVDEENNIIKEGFLQISLIRKIGGEEEVIRVKDLALFETPLLEKQLTIISQGQNIQIFVDGETLMNEEVSGFPRGQVSIIGSIDLIIKDIDLESESPTTWISNISSAEGSVIAIKEDENENDWIYLNKHTSTVDPEIKQTLYIEEAGTYTTSFQYKGEGSLVLDNESVALEHASEWQVFSTVKEWVAGDHTLVFNTNTSLSIDNVQTEKGSIKKGYLDNSSDEIKTEEPSMISYPSKDIIDTEKGSVSLFVKTRKANKENKQVLFSYGDDPLDRIEIAILNGKITFTYGEETMTHASSVSDNAWTHIVCSWEEDRCEIIVNNEKNEYLSPLSTQAISNVVLIGTNKEKESIDGEIDELSIYGDILLEEDVFLLSEGESAGAHPIFYTNLNYAISNKGDSIIEVTPAPEYGSPIIVEKRDGSPMQKVSFFDTETGEYTHYNKEPFLYDGVSDYFDIGYNNIEQESFRVLVKKENGEDINESYEVKGSRIYIVLSEEEKIALKNTWLDVYYQLQDSYTIDFNRTSPDVFQINLGEFKGQDIRVIYEGNKYENKKLGKMVELNPLLNPNTNGFLYVTQNTDPLVDISIRTSESFLHANGSEKMVVTVDTFDANGNYSGSAHLKATAQKGNIYPIRTMASYKIRNQSGRHMFEYQAPTISEDDTGLNTLHDKISFSDEETGRGGQISFPLRTIKTIIHVVEKNDTLEKIAREYGSSEESIATENNITIETLREKLKNNTLTDTNLKIPILFQSVSTSESKTEEDIMRKRGDINEAIFSYLGSYRSEVDEELFNILDQANDGVLDFDDMFIVEKLYDEQVLSLHKELMTWKAGV